jgi:aspartate kinase
MQINVFKFGGASLSNADGVRNVAAIINRHRHTPLVVVVSAMGKTTNMLETVLRHYLSQDPVAMVGAFQLFEQFHTRLTQELFPDETHEVHGVVASLVDQVRGYLRRGHLHKGIHPDSDFEYDQVVSFGELLSSAIVDQFLRHSGIPLRCFDVRDLVITDTLYRDARVNWEITGNNIRKALVPLFESHDNRGKIALTQGFIASDGQGNTTTLGREGSDFSAAIFAYSLHAHEMTIWKDVPGVMNADPRWMNDAVKLTTLSYREAIELAYYGATVIHPRTIKPLENAGIRLHVRSFADPDQTGTIIERLKDWKIDTPIFIRKQAQVLLSVSPRDFSFIMEENLGEIFQLFARHRVKVNVMHNSAISFSVCIQSDREKIRALTQALSHQFEVRYNEGVELITIRHYTEKAILQVSQNRKILMELRSRNTVQLVLQ